MPTSVYTHYSAQTRYIIESGSKNGPHSIKSDVVTNNAQRSHYKITALCTIKS